MILKQRSDCLEEANGTSVKGLFGAPRAIAWQNVSLDHTGHAALLGGGIFPCAACRALVHPAFPPKNPPIESGAAAAGKL